MLFASVAGVAWVEVLTQRTQAHLLGVMAERVVAAGFIEYGVFSQLYPFQFQLLSVLGVRWEPKTMVTILPLRPMVVTVARPRSTTPPVGPQEVRAVSESRQIL